MAVDQISPKHHQSGLANCGVVLQHGQSSAAAEDYRVRMSKPSYNQLIILFIPAALLAAYLDAGSLARFVDLKLPLWVMICWSIYVAIMLHVTTMAVLGSLWLKMPIKEMAIGFGKRWLK